MSKMNDLYIRQTDSTSLDNALETRELRAEVARLEAVVSRAAADLAEGDPAGGLRTISRGLRSAGHPVHADWALGQAGRLEAVLAALKRAAP